MGGAPRHDAAYSLSATFVQSVDEAIHNKYFWAYCMMVNILSGFLTALASRCEGCHCHEDELLSNSTWFKRAEHTRHEGNSCCYKGRRAPELAAGHLDQHVEWLSSGALAEILSFCNDLTPDQRATLLIDWNSAVDKALLEITLKTEHWKLLPWSLAVIGHHDVDIARSGLRRCREMYRSTES